MGGLGGWLGFAGLDQLGPDTGEAIWKQINPRNALFRVPLNKHRQFGRRGAESIGHVLQVAHACLALARKGFALSWRQSEEKWFEFHERITPQGVIRVNTFRCNSCDEMVA